MSIKHLMIFDPSYDEFYVSKRLYTKFIKFASQILLFLIDCDKIIENKKN